MLLHLPAEYENAEKLPLSVAKRLVFSDRMLRNFPARAYERYRRGAELPRCYGA